MTRTALICIFLFQTSHVTAERPLRLDRIWHQLSQEPSVYELQKMAIKRLHRFGVSSMVQRSRWAAALPKRLGFKVQQYQDEGWRGTVSDSDRWTSRQLQDARLAWRVEAEWDLSKLVYTSESLPLHRAHVAHFQKEQAVSEELTRLFYTRQRLQLQYLLSDTTSILKRGTLWTEIEEATARIDLLTGGGLRLSQVEWWRDSSSIEF